MRAAALDLSSLGRNTMRNIRMLAAVLAVLASTALGLAAVPAGASAAATYTAVTAVSGRPDGGNGTGTYWAQDAFSRKASLTFGGAVALSDCGGSTGTGHCYAWSGSVTDSAGSFTTIPGIGSPSGRGPAEAVAITGQMAGWVHSLTFYSSWKSASAALVPAAENDGGNIPGGRHTTTNWLEQFFGAGATFYDVGAAETFWYRYTAGFGADKACPNDASQWVDSTWQNDGQAVTAGNITAPDASSCT
jgi:hypothetical protein